MSLLDRRNRRGPVEADPEVLAKISEGEEALHGLTKVEVRPTWVEDWKDNDTACMMCWRQLPHTRRTHELLLDETQRQLPRHHPRNKIRAAELSWRRSSGETISLEDLLRREFLKESPPSANEFAPLLGVHRSTLIQWLRWLGLPVQDRMDAWNDRREEGR